MRSILSKFRKFQSLTAVICCLCLPMVYANADDLKSNPIAKKQSNGYSIQQSNSDVDESVGSLALNEVGNLKETKQSNLIAEAGPILLVPLVFAALALVAVGRRKEREN